ncbi:hypothetical protein DDB_G0292734, partial [Dictyostelium discoideum AX4]
TVSLSSSSSSSILTPPISSMQQQHQQQPPPLQTTSPTGQSQQSIPSTPSSLSSSSTTPSVSTGTSLSRSLEHCKHTSAVGTLTYSSPEQKKGLYNEKTDIYSLGIILFELYFPISTRMEKARVLTDLRNGVLPKSFLQKYPKVSELILLMMKTNPDERPSASDILKSDLFGKLLSVPELENIIKQQQSLIEMLKQEIFNLKSPVLINQTSNSVPTLTSNLLNSLSLHHNNNNTIVQNNHHHHHHQQQQGVPSSLPSSLSHTSKTTNPSTDSNKICINPLVESSFINSTRYPSFIE